MADGLFKLDILPLPRSQLYFALEDALDKLVKLIVRGEQPPVLSIVKSANTCALNSKEKNRVDNIKKIRTTLITVSFGWARAVKTTSAVQDR
jgi:hypothetical protein